MGCSRNVVEIELCLVLLLELEGGQGRRTILRYLLQSQVRSL